MHIPFLLDTTTITKIPPIHTASTSANRDPNEPLMAVSKSVSIELDPVFGKLSNVVYIE